MSYRQGTISVTNGSTAVVGTSTLFKTVGVTAGDQLYLTDANGLQSGYCYEVASVTDDTHLTLLQNYQGTTASGNSYAIVDMAGDSTVPNFARRLAEFYAAISNGASPTVAGLVKLYTALGTNTDGALSQNALNNLINANSGIAGLDSSAKVAVANLPVDTASGIAGLDTSAKLATSKLYTNVASGVAGLDSSAKVPIANLPVVGAQPSNIIEQGRNSNGYYVKFAKGTIYGTILCYLTAQIPVSSVVSVGETLTATVTLPVTFDAAPICACTKSEHAATFYTEAINSAVSTLSLVARVTYSSPVVGEVLTLPIICIGRWS